MRVEQRVAALAVERVLQGATLSAALAAVGGPALGSGRRALVQELTYGTLRHWGRLRAIVQRLARRPFADATLLPLIAVALYQIDHTRAPAFAIVDHAVEAAVRVARPAAKPLVNALLRRYLRERDAVHEAVLADPEARWSHPRWWIERVRREFPDAWETILEAGNARPPLMLRVNRRVTDRDALAARFAQADIAFDVVGACALHVREPRPVQELPGYAEGAFSVQDAGAQLAAPLLDVSDGMRVLDACAAPGGKTTHVLELADVDLLALDASEARLGRVHENLDRLGFAQRNVRVVAADAALTSAWWDGRAFDRILADVPCTASGVVRRHPDGKWLRRETDIASFALQQARLLDALWPTLAPGGVLLYATCSVFREENAQQVEAFLARTPDALRETLTLAPQVIHHDGQLLPSLPGAVHNQDGFFYALLRRT